VGANDLVSGRLSRRDVLQWAAAVGLTISPLGLIGCGGDEETSAGSGGGSPASGPRAGGSLSSGWTISPPGLDPHVEGTLPSIRATFLLYDPLVDLDDDGKPVGALAESWEADGPDMVFTLREGVTFHGGEPFTADDVVATIKRVLDPKTASWKSSFVGSVTDAVKEDDLTVRLVQKKFSAALVNQLFWVQIVPKAWAEGSADRFKSEANGTGAWKLGEWDPQNQMVLEKNPSYWRPDAPLLDDVTIQILPDENTAIAALRSGQIGHYTLNDARNASKLRDDSKLKLVETVAAGSVESQINFRKPEMQKLEVRQALSLAMDREAILQAAAGGLGVVSGPIAPNQKDYHVPASELPNYTRDVAKAKELMAQAGYADGFDMTIITSSEYPVMQITAELFADQWREIGVRATVKPLDTTGWLNAKNKPPFDWHVANNLEFPGSDPDALGQLFGTGSSTAVQGDFEFPELDALLVRGRSMKDEAARVELYREAQIMAAELQPVFFTFAPNFVDALGADVEGFVGRSDNTPRNLDRVYLAA
jgi:peptide/nickel transport system substrate-binding protein